jgi:hypothetical protein
MKVILPLFIGLLFLKRFNQFKQRIFNLIMQRVQALVVIRCYLLSLPTTGITRMKFAAGTQGNI